MQEASVPQVTAAEARERLMAFMAEVVAGLPHVRQRENAVLYVRGLVEHGGRKSLWPTLFRLGEDAARYESLQQFLADSPWEPSQLVRAAAERVYPHLGVAAWVVDDTGIPKDGTHSPGVKRQYSGTLGKIGNCQIAVSLHAVGERGTVPLGWALYLPEEWCEDLPRRRQARSRRGSPSRPSRNWRPLFASRRHPGGLPVHRSWPMRPMATLPSFAPLLPTGDKATWSLSLPNSACLDRKAASSRLSPPAGGADREPLCPGPSGSRPSRDPRPAVPGPRMAHRGMAREQGGPDRLLALQSPG